ncbi:MAG: hypothetical protein Q9192_007713, partial [Flavoplaca navasiana]
MVKQIRKVKKKAISETSVIDDSSIKLNKRVKATPTPKMRISTRANSEDTEMSEALYISQQNSEVYAADVVSQSAKSSIVNFYTQFTIQLKQNSSKFDLVKTLLD